MGGKNSATSDRVNVLLIVIDQFRADLLQDSGLGQVAQLGNLRALQEECTVFDQHFSVVAPCGPSRVSLLTGQYAMNHRAVRNGTPLRHDTPNLALEARAAGYDPLLFGYTDTAWDPRALAADDPRLHSYEELMPGFDERLRLRMETDDSAWRDHLAGKGCILPPYPECYRPKGDRLADPAQYSAQDSDTAFLTDRFLAEMAQQPPGWFAALTYIRPHPPLVAPAPYNRLYDPADMPAPRVGSYDDHPFLAPARAKQTPASMVVGFPDLDDSPKTTAALRAIYLGLASEVDTHIGRVVDWLKQSGQWDDTLLVITADHGEMLGDFGLWGKGTFHDAAFHVPLLLRDPGRPASHGRRVETMTQSIDIAPTVLARMGADIPDTMNGRSLMGLLENGHSLMGLLENGRSLTGLPENGRSQMGLPENGRSLTGLPENGRSLTGLPDGQAGADISFSELDFGNPVAPTVFMRALGLAANRANLAVLRTKRHRLVQFAQDLPPILFDMEQDGENTDVSARDGSVLLDLTQKMLCHRMANPDSLFARSMVGPGGVRRGMH